jgi:hypothetical protein
MKTRNIFGVIAVAVLLSTALVYAQTSQEAFYTTCIDKRIAECEVKASLDETRSPHLLRLAAINQEEAAFYRDKREELVKEMVTTQLETKAHAVDHFLIKAFFAEYPREIASSK